ncbi:hypothetical protein BD626DRAFT_280586 [Schizophyllum amplum]|uniref:Uncharacterized protein n=1 Tax=Schizophyllum amplum TaxID=97359 RepID=A0A550BT67_9AGAR|nr:hypothetical protein BD626DRAFT_280586 [Auriculariopsis ampla]
MSVVASRYSTGGRGGGRRSTRCPAARPVRPAAHRPVRPAPRSSPRSAHLSSPRLHRPRHSTRIVQLTRPSSPAAYRPTRRVHRLPAPLVHRLQLLVDPPNPAHSPIASSALPASTFKHEPPAHRPTPAPPLAESSLASTDPARRVQLVDPTRRIQLLARPSRPAARRPVRLAAHRPAVQLLIVSTHVSLQLTASSSLALHAPHRPASRSSPPDIQPGAGEEGGARPASGVPRPACSCSPTCV